MSWSSTDILGSDLTKDFQYEILKTLLSPIEAMRYISEETDFSTVVTSLNKQRMSDNLPSLYNMAKSLNKIEEAWQMQVLAKFIADNNYYCTAMIYKESARVLWNNLKYEIDNIESFGWAHTFDKADRIAKLQRLYEIFGVIRWAGLESNPQHSPFGITTPATTSAFPYRMLSTDQNPYHPYHTPGGAAIPATPGNVTFNTISPAPVPPPVVPPRESISVRTNMGTIECTVMRVTQDWVQFTVDSKQWSYRTIKVDRGYILQTRWGSINTSTSRLRLTSKMYHGLYNLNTTLSATLRRKQNSGYIQVRDTF